MSHSWWGKVGNIPFAFLMRAEISRSRECEREILSKKKERVKFDWVVMWFSTTLYSHVVNQTANFFGLYALTGIYPSISKMGFKKNLFKVYLFSLDEMKFK